MKAEFDQMPEAIVKHDLRGHYAIRYNIQQVERPANEFEPERTSYQCDIAIADGNTRDAFINAIIRTRYTADQEFAIHRKTVAQEECAQAEFDAYNSFVNEAKGIVDNALNPVKPETSWTNADIQEWLTNNGITWTTSLTKAGLLALVP